jgi:hypothetical protein
LDERAILRTPGQYLRLGFAHLGKQKKQSSEKGDQKYVSSQEFRRTPGGSGSDRNAGISQEAPGRNEASVQAFGAFGEEYDR